MKKRMMLIATIFTALMNLIGGAHARENVAGFRDGLSGLNNKEGMTLLYLDDAVTAVKDRHCDCSLASHSSHCSHSSHSSHSSHRSHYSSR